MQYEEPQLFEIKITQYAQGDAGDPPLTLNGETSGGLPPGPDGDNPFK